MVVCGGYEEQNHCQIRFIVDEAIVEGSAFSIFFCVGVDAQCFPTATVKCFSSRSVEDKC